MRAAAIKTGWKPSPIETHTYIFLSDVITQSPSGERPDPNWPAPHTNTNPFTDLIQCIDYGMDPNVINDSRYVNLVDDALLSIPTISLVTDLNNLFDLSTGIWVNAAQEGRLWERPCSIELIYPPNPQGPGFPDLVQVPDANGGYRWDLPSDMRGGFHIDAGMRIRGGWSSHSDNPKHAFRLFFRPEYGEAKLMYPLFGTDGDDEFDHMDLRTSQNYCWSYQYDQRNTMVRDVFSRDTQRDMGQPYTRSRYYHLYINGQYWGIFQTQERSDASYAVSYFGGEKEDYDVVKVNGWPSADDYKIAATDGNLDAYKVLWQAATAGFSTDTAYYGVQGLKPDGTYDPNGRKLVDIDNLIDYMLCVYYTGDKDGPISSPRNNTRPNNLWAIYNRNKPDGFKFFRHDCEQTLDIGEPDRTGPYDLWQFEYFTPQWLSQKLTGHPEYVMRFADRVHKRFFNGGVLMPQSAVAHWTARANEIDLAIIAESARWGDAKRPPPLPPLPLPPPRTKDDDWLPAINNVTNNYFPSRTGVVLDQFRAKGWYPNINAPSFNRQGGYVSTSDTFTITDPCASGGTIYYTTDGSDPRLPIGEQQKTFVIENASKKVLVPASDIGTTWRGGSEPYNDSSWTSGTGGVGYERITGYESYIDINVGSAMYNKNGTCYIRIPFTVDACDINNITTLTLRMRYDDGFVAYINGTEVKRAYAPTTPIWNSLSTTSREATSAFESFDISAYINTLHAGTNILAIHGLNGTTTTSSDFLICTQLIRKA